MGYSSKGFRNEISVPPKLNKADSLCLKQGFLVLAAQHISSTIAVLGEIKRYNSNYHKMKIGYKALRSMLVILLFSACSTGRYQKFDYESSKNPWINNFKDQVFFAALKESYKNEPAILSMIAKKDAFNPYDDIAPEELELATELAKKLIQNMPPPTMCDECPSGVNYYMANSLHYYSSKELDVIARNAYKKHLKIVDQ